MIKLPNSMEPSVLAENIVKLRDTIAAVVEKTLPATTSATTGQILGLTGENKTPAWVDPPEGLPSTTEATTGQILGLTGENKTPAWVDVTGGVNYSTEEQDTGLTWIDGSPIYQKTYGITVSSLSSSWTTLDSSFTGLRVFPVGHAFLTGDNGNDHFAYPFGVSNNNGTLRVKMLESILGLVGEQYFTIQYTKAATPTKSKRKTTKKED